MSKRHNIVVLIDNEHVRDKLAAIYSEPTASRRLGFDVEVLIDPGDEQIDLAVQGNTCLFFVEASVDRSGLNRLEVISELSCEGGHQLILVADTDIDYLQIAEQFEIGNILMGDQFDADMICAVSRRLLGEEFFGFAPFFPDGYPVYDRSFRIAGHVDTKNMARSYFKDFGDTLEEQHRPFFYNYTSELLINAIAYGVCGITEDQRDARPGGLPPELEIPRELGIDIHIVRDREKYGFSISDQRGSMRPARILNKIRRQSTIGDEVLPPGIEDHGGRGLYILTHRTRLVFNIMRGVRTEVILMYFFSEEKNRYDPLIINERYPILTAVQGAKTRTDSR
jgi:hypothetical protein